MHEIGLMQELLEISLAQARAAGAERIETIVLRVGALSGVVPESLEFAFQCLARDTLAQDAKLEIEPVPVLCFCPDCQREFQPEGAHFACPDCGRASAEIRHGQELELVSLRVT